MIFEYDVSCCFNFVVMFMKFWKNRKKKKKKKIQYFLRRGKITKISTNFFIFYLILSCHKFINNLEITMRSAKVFDDVTESK